MPKQDDTTYDSRLENALGVGTAAAALGTGAMASAYMIAKLLKEKKRRHLEKSSAEVTPKHEKHLINTMDMYKQFAPNTYDEENTDFYAPKVTQHIKAISRNSNGWAGGPQAVIGGSMGGVLGGALGFIAGSEFAPSHKSRPWTTAGGVALGALGGGYLGYRHGLKERDEAKEISKTYSKEEIRAVLDKEIERRKNSHLHQGIKHTLKAYDASGMAGLLTAPLTIGAVSTIVPYQGALDELKDKHLDEMTNHFGLTGRVDTIKPTAEKLRWYQENAFFTDNPKKEIKGYNRTGKNPEVGAVTALSKRMWRPGIMSHELGHANIHDKGKVMKFLQDKMYGLSHNPVYGFGASLGAYMATKDEDDPVKGALKGGLVGGAIHSPMLASEFEASRRGINAMMHTSLPTKQKILNSVGLAPAFLTYLLSTAGVNAGVGALHALSNRKANKAREQDEKRKARAAVH